jgi:hypothetical protein
MLPLPRSLISGFCMRTYSACLLCAVLMACSSTSRFGEVTQPLCDNETATCPCPGSPILIDIAGNGIELTAWRDGVEFGLRPGTNGIVSWTGADSDDAWLVMDRNDNGTIDDGTEMFGNFTVQPPLRQGEEGNGFRALAVLDVNEDGRVDALDPGFGRLRLWRDLDHDGISLPEELSELPALGVDGLSVQYTPSSRVDRHGNRFAYRAEVFVSPGRTVGMTAWDVWLTGTVPTRTSDSQVASSVAAESDLSLLCAGDSNALPDLTPSIVTPPVARVPLIYCVSVSWKTRNVGTANSGTYGWGVYLNGMQLQHADTSPSLAPGGSKTINSVICPPYRAFNINTVTIYVNTQNPPSLNPPPVRGSVVEESYSNNFVSTSFFAAD